MSQQVNLDAYKKFAAARRLGSRYPQDLLGADPDEDTLSGLTVQSLSSAITNVTALYLQEGEPRSVGEFRIAAAKRPERHSGVTLLRPGESTTKDLMKAAEEWIAYVGPDYPASPPRIICQPNTTSTLTDLVASSLLLSTGHSAVFSQLEEIQEHIADPAVLIAAYRKALPSRYADRLTSRLNEVLADVREERPDGPWISIDSLLRFYEFLVANPRLAYPRLSVTPNGDLYARWRENERRLFSAEFLPSGDVRFVIFKPNRKHENKVVRLSGLTTVDILIDEARGHGATEWIME